MQIRYLTRSVSFTQVLVHGFDYTQTECYLAPEAKTVIQLLLPTTGATYHHARQIGFLRIATALNMDKIYGK